MQWRTQDFGLVGASAGIITTTLQIYYGRLGGGEGGGRGRGAGGKGDGGGGGAKGGGKGGGGRCK